MHQHIKFIERAIKEKGYDVVRVTFGQDGGGKDFDIHY
jgi:hypothetical protein